MVKRLPRVQQQSSRPIDCAEMLNPSLCVHRDARLPLSSVFPSTAHAGASAARGRAISDRISADIYRDPGKPPSKFNIFGMARSAAFGSSAVVSFCSPQNACPLPHTGPFPPPSLDRRGARAASKSASLAQSTWLYGPEWLLRARLHSLRRPSHLSGRFLSRRRGHILPLLKGRLSNGE